MIYTPSPFKARLRLTRLVLCASCLFGVDHLARAQEASVAVATDIAPYESLMLEVMRGAGFTPVVAHYPSERSFRMLQDGKVDLEFARSAKAVEEFKSQVVLVGPVGCVEVSAIVNSKRPVSIRSANDLRGHEVGAVLGSKQALDYLRGEQVRFNAVANRESAYGMLQLGRVDVVIDNRMIGLGTLARMAANHDLRVEGLPLASRPVYLVLRHHLKEWGPRLQSAFAAAMSSGDWQTKLTAVNLSLGLPSDVGLSCLKGGALMAH